jgi:hypothetical protein
MSYAQSPDTTANLVANYAPKYFLVPISTYLQGAVPPVLTGAGAAKNITAAIGFNPVGFGYTKARVTVQLNFSVTAGTTMNVTFANYPELVVGPFTTSSLNAFQSIATGFITLTSGSNALGELKSTPPTGLQYSLYTCYIEFT